MIESIKRYGVITPIILRPREEGGYELISGHRRVYASNLAEKEKIPAIIRELDNDASVILMVDSNLQRENILPSEKAFALKMKMEAMKSQGKKRYKTSRQIVGKLEVAEIIGHDMGESGRQIQRYIRLTNLSRELLDMVDNNVISFNPAVELSYLKPEEQKAFIEAMDYGQASPSLSQSQRIKKLSQEGKCTLEALCAIMNEEKKSNIERITLKNDMLRKYFPKSYTPRQMEDTIIKLLEQWKKQCNREQRL